MGRYDAIDYGDDPEYHDDPDLEFRLDLAQHSNGTCPPGCQFCHEAINVLASSGKEEK